MSPTLDWPAGWIAGGLAVPLVAWGLAWAAQHYDPPGAVEVPEQHTTPLGGP